MATAWWERRFHRIGVTIRRSALVGLRYSLETPSRYEAAPPVGMAPPYRPYLKGLEDIEVSVARVLKSCPFASLSSSALWTLIPGGETRPPLAIPQPPASPR